MSFHYALFSNPLLPGKLKFQSQISTTLLLQFHFSHQHLFSKHSLATYILSSIAMPEAPSHYLCNNPNGKVDDDVVITKNNNNKALEYIEDVTSNADEIQTRVLAEILSSSAHAEYLQRHGLDGRTERESFKKIMPVVTYEDLKPDIDRIANGDTSPILCSKPISEFLTSSGTSGGERKLMPTIEDELQRKSLLYSLLMPVMDQFVPGLEKGKGMYFLFVKSEAKTPGGS
ncbi:hypothetical protein ACSQ67_023518 [Phaseolus vulgaris]